MALVSSSMPIHLRQPQVHGYSHSSSSSRGQSARSPVEIEEQEEVESFWCTWEGVQEEQGDIDLATSECFNG